jgi:5-methylcytosine-specific restriction endonuclease McrA
MSDGLMFPKPVKRKSAKAKLQKRQAKLIKTVRAQVFERDVTCRACGFIFERTGERYQWGLDSDQFNLHMHEMVFRSKTVGQPIERRFNTKNCIVLCRGCHQAVHDAKLSIVVGNETLGANGPVMFEERKGR